MDRESLVKQLQESPASFWRYFAMVADNIEVEWLLLQVIYDAKASVPQECFSKYRSIMDKVEAMIEYKNISINEIDRLINEALRNHWSIYIFLYIKNYKQLLFALNFGNVVKDMGSFVNTISLDILRNMNPKHYFEFVNLLKLKGFNDVEASKLAMQIYHVLGYFKGKDFLLERYGKLSKKKIRNIFGKISLEDILYENHEPILNKTIINLMLGESYRVIGTPIKAFLSDNTSSEVVFFMNNLNLILDNWNTIREEFIRRSNLEGLKLKLNIREINMIIRNIISMKREIKRQEGFWGKKKTRYEMIPGFEIRDMPLLNSDVFDYIQKREKYVINPRLAPQRSVEISRMMENNMTKKFPEINIDEKGYHLFTFHPQDRDIISAGFRTNNCFVPTGMADACGVGKGLLMYCATTPYGGGIEIRDRYNKTLAFCPILRNGNVLLIHSIEGVSLTSEEKEFVSLLLKRYATEVVSATQREEDGGVVAVLTTEKYNYVLDADVIDESKKFHIYDETAEYQDIYGDFAHDNKIVALKDGVTEREIVYDRKVLTDYDFSIKDLSNNQHVSSFTLEELAAIKELNDLKDNIRMMADTRRMFMKSGQDALAGAMLREIKKAEDNFASGYNALFNISSIQGVDQFESFNEAIKTIEHVCEKVGSEIEFNFYTLREIYYSDYWFIAVDDSGRLYYECIPGVEYQFLIVLNEVKKRTLEMNGGGR